RALACGISPPSVNAPLVNANGPLLASGVSPASLPPSRGTHIGPRGAGAAISPFEHGTQQRSFVGSTPRLSGQPPFSWRGTGFGDRHSFTTAPSFTVPASTGSRAGASSFDEHAAPTARKVRSEDHAIVRSMACTIGRRRDAVILGGSYPFRRRDAVILDGSYRS